MKRASGIEPVSPVVRCILLFFIAMSGPVVSVLLSEVDSFFLANAPWKRAIRYACAQRGVTYRDLRVLTT